MDWEVSKSSLACTACAKSFVEDNEVFSALYDEKPSFVRRDYCPACWPAVSHEALFSFWQTRIPRKDAPVRRFVDDEIVLDFFRKLEGETEPSKVNFRYVLGLLLMRKKTLKFTEFKRGETGAVLVLHDRTHQCNYEVLDPNLTEEQIQQVTQEVGQILNTRV